MEAMISFVDAYRDEHGVEPICRVLAIAPSTYHAHSRRRACSETAPARVRRDAGLSVEIQKVLMRTFRSTACARCGGDGTRTVTTLPAARSRG